MNHQALQSGFTRKILLPGMILLGLLLGLVTQAREQDPPRGRDFRETSRTDLPAGLEIAHDGAGELRLFLDEQMVARIQLLLLDSSAESEAPELLSPPLSLADAEGADLISPLHAEVSLSEGMVRGLRGPHGDDDGDGQEDEDPFDGRDNDQDGQIDEDFAAIGEQMHTGFSRVHLSAREDIHLRSSVFSWPFAHVDDILFWDSWLEGESGPPQRLLPGLRVQTHANLQIEEVELCLHLPFGKAPRPRAFLSSFELDRGNAGRLHVAILRLDGEPPLLLEEQNTLAWSLLRSIRWPLAILAAPTRDILHFQASQALLTFAGGSEKIFQVEDGEYRLPAMCGRCQAARLHELHLSLEQASAQEIYVRTDLSSVEYGNCLSWEFLEVDGLALGEYFVSSEAGHSLYRLPQGSVIARRLLDAATGHRPRVELSLLDGNRLEPEQLSVQISPELQLELSSNRNASRLPTHLSPYLLESWPNPFQESTKIRFRIPMTIGEAFDFEGDPPQGIDESAPAPFGPFSPVRIRIFNVGGQLIRTLEEGREVQGELSISWNGMDDQGRAVAAGAYYVHVEVEDYSVTRRVLRLKP